ncbi:hypothetical protein DFJ43DRAFT_1039898 [Lentinula guzmanii]|uniref:DUF6570 domain-containing protein n=1 Tax=Lentinula guzmanii TaxID=2804957 RepID=A0AA38MZH0_9AGAR|nr:hypothetical protein DFJ43DRAFT_1039898 [Lentinula guzmanii]
MSDAPVSLFDSISKEDLNSLTMKEILHMNSLLLDAAVRIKIPDQVRRGTKARLIEYILQNGSQGLFQNLRNHLNVKQTGQESIIGKKRIREEEEVINSRKTPCIEEQDVETVGVQENLKGGQFMEVLTMTELQKCHQAFYRATSDAAVTPIVCGVCTRENNIGESPSSYQRVPLKSIPNSHRLIPNTPHPLHTLFEGKLLEKAGIINSPNSDILVTVCSDCWGELNHKTDLPPKFSLANDMWIGEVPIALQGLTFPEQLLIAQLYPHVYVFKLFPKKIGGKRNAAFLQNGMRGNVTTFELDNTGIISMLEGKLMPRPAAILASVITVTFCGLGKLPKKWLRNTFRVRRHVTEDVGIVDEEGASSYVPTGEDAAIGTEFGKVDGNADRDPGVNLHEKDSNEPDVIPLQISGVIDTDTTKLTGNELMEWGLLNLWKEADKGAYAVRHGREPVSDFGQPRAGESDGVDRSAGSGINFFERAFPLLFPHGRGGIESDCPNLVDFSDHIKWALLYHDGRFRRHETFAFTAFGIQQRRQALGASRLQTRRQNFEKDAHILSSITTEKLNRKSIRFCKVFPFRN